MSTTTTSIPLSCPKCGAALRAKSDKAGKTLPCPRCKGPVAVPPRGRALTYPVDALDEIVPPSLPPRHASSGSDLARRMQKMRLPRPTREPRRRKMGAWKSTVIYAQVWIATNLLLAGVSLLVAGASFLGAKVARDEARVAAEEIKTLEWRQDSADSWDERFEASKLVISALGEGARAELAATARQYSGVVAVVAMLLLVGSTAVPMYLLARARDALA